MNDEKLSRDQVESAAKNLRIDWWIPDNEPLHFANQMLVQFDGTDFYLSFFELRPPTVLGSAEEKLEAIKSMESIRAKCVSRVVVNKARMSEFFKAIKETIEKNLPSTEESTDDDS